MKKSEILKHLAPCGLDCGRCFMYKHGPIGESARSLKQALQGFEKMAQRMQDRTPVMAEYGAFSRVLDLLTQAACIGCRQGGASLPFCATSTCFKEKQVDFCYECREFPCLRNKYPDSFAKRWQENNKRIQAIGLKQYYEEQLKKPRYE
jgi:hypothetical protein